ncbi:MAG: hypothetical protein VB084_13060 [Syntrophomonadaceae bacterium]|nr:hypothetical protein [Syntrophomonadaceae bacterium]
MNDAREKAWNDDLYIPQTAKSTKARRNRKKKIFSDNVLADLEPCPRSVDQVYSLGVRIQYHIGEIYLELERLNQGNAKSHYKALALRQLDGKDEIEKLANINLNHLLTYFYNNGGPIIEPPVSEEMVQEMRPFYIRLSENFLKQMDFIVNLASKGRMTITEIESTIDHSVSELYLTMSMLFPIEEIKDAFNDLIMVRKNISR